MTSTQRTSPPKLNLDDKTNFNLVTAGRSYGIALGVITSVYLLIINLAYGGAGEDSLGVPMGPRFAKHIFIVPIVWLALSSYAKTMTEGHVFKGGIGLLARIALWTALTIGALNLAFFITTGSSFQQFLNEGETFLTATVNSGLLIFETSVFVMILGFVILQALKGKGSPED